MRQPSAAIWCAMNPKPDPQTPADDLFTLARQILQSRKYRRLGIPEQTVQDVLARALAVHGSRKEALKAARQKLHNIVAPYLGDLDYDQARASLDRAFGSRDPQAVKAACERLLAAHASTRERLPILEEFYARIFAFIGIPEVILDLACGLNPLAFPWMGLPATTRYHAYDIHRPRIELINHYFRLQGLPPLAAVQDILVEPPREEAQVAFFFKEAHRFEQRRPGANRPFWQALRVRWLVVSLPASSLTGRHHLAEQQRRLVYGSLQGLPWEVNELLIGDELVFCIDKSDGTQETLSPG